MTSPTPLPQAVRPLVEFAALLRSQGFAVAPEQTVAFLAATGLLGPRRIDDIRRAAHATLAPPPDRHPDFEALFRAFFHGDGIPTPGDNDSEDETVIKDDRRGRLEQLAPSRVNESGQATSAQEVLSGRAFRSTGSDERLARFARRAPKILPRRRAFRWAAARSGEAIDLRRTMRSALRNDGDAPVLAERRKRTKQRNLLLLIDVSGSMKAHTQDYLRVAHAVVQAADRAEVFTFGTRLTRITRALALRDPRRALAEASATVEDWDGGTRIGEALLAFLAVPRFAGHARGALTLILSDGLERARPDEMLDAVTRLARRSWRLAWLTPLAADPRYRPETAALRACLPWLDDLANGGSVASITDYILAVGTDDSWSPARWAGKMSHP